MRQVNARLAPYGRKLGPDPASETACTVGGVVANNSSGMACGTEFNTYRTLESLVLVLPSGTVLDTGAPDADARLRAAEPALHAGLLRLRDRVRGNPDSVRRVRAPVRDEEHHGLRAELVPRPRRRRPTSCAPGSWSAARARSRSSRRRRSAPCPCYRHAATGLLVFDALGAATAALPALVAAGPATIELLDAAVPAGGPARPAGRRRRCAASPSTGTPRCWWSGRSPTRRRWPTRVADAGPVLAGLPLSAPARLTAEPARPGRAVAHPQGPVRGGGRRPPVRHHRAAGGHRRAGRRRSPAPATR